MRFGGEALFAVADDPLDHANGGRFVPIVALQRLVASRDVQHDRSVA
jgi:hypothetical protein